MFYPNPSILALHESDHIHIYQLKTSPAEYSLNNTILNAIPFVSFYSHHFSVGILEASVSPNGKFLLRNTVKNSFSNKTLSSGARIYNLEKKFLYKKYPPPIKFTKKSLAERIKLNGRTVVWGSNSKWFIKEGPNGLLYLRRINSDQKRLNFKPKLDNESIYDIQFTDNEDTLMISTSNDITLWSWDPPDTNPIEKTLKMQDELKD